MDILTMQRKNAGLEGRWASDIHLPAHDGGNEDRINKLVKQIAAKGPTKSQWGGSDYPIDIKDYGQYLSALQCLSWILRSVGYETSFLSKGGLHYNNGDYLAYSNLFDHSASKILALVAIGKDGRHYRFSRDGASLRIRKFDNITRAISPLGTSADAGSKPISVAIVKELVRVMSTQSSLDPKDPLSLRRWGRIVQSKALKPVGAGVLKSQLQLQFRKV